MNKNQQIKHIFQLYIGKRFSRGGRALFGRWLFARQHQSEKSTLIRQLWEQTEGEITPETRQDWNKLERKIIPSATLRIGRWRKLGNYAAAVGLLLVSIGITTWLTRHYTPVMQADMEELFVPYGEDRQVILPDGSAVWVKAGSLLVYPEQFDRADTRTIYLTGEATFKVQKNKEKPFIVKTACIDVQALGTVFTVEAYPNASLTTATLEEGSVLVSLKEGNRQSVILKPSEQLLYAHDTHRSEVRTVDLARYKMERRGYLIFENATFSEMIAEIEKKFNVVVHYNAKRYAGEYYNVRFSPDENIEDVFDILRQLAGLEYTMRGKDIIIN